MTKVGPSANFSSEVHGILPNPIDPSSSIRGILFDLDGTLYRQRPLRSLMALELLTLPLERPGLARRRLRALRAFRRAQERLRENARSVSHGDPAASQVAEAAAASGLAVAEVEALVADWMVRRPLKYLQFCRPAGLDRLLGIIERAGVPAGVLSDYPAREKLQALGLGTRFSPVLSASDPEILAVKPSPRGFQRACALWGLTPSSVLYVGDRVDVDAAGAAAAGMPCVILGSPPGRHRGYVVFNSLEQLSRVFDRRA